jgi:hypothetical protein
MKNVKEELKEPVSNARRCILENVTWYTDNRTWLKLFEPIWVTVALQIKPPIRVTINSTSKEE